MNRNGLTDMILDTKKALAFYESVKPNCTTCEHIGDGDYCKLHDAIVPKDYLPTGCDQWSFDEVPF